MCFLFSYILSELEAIFMKNVVLIVINVTTKNNMMTRASPHRDALLFKQYRNYVFVWICVLDNHTSVLLSSGVICSSTCAFHFSGISENYSTCSPDLQTCPDSFCDAVESKDPAICPQDCTSMKCVFFCRYVNMKSAFYITCKFAYRAILTILFVSEEEAVIGGHERGLRNGIKAGYGTCYCYSEKCFCEKDDIEGELTEISQNWSEIWCPQDPALPNLNNEQHSDNCFIEKQRHLLLQRSYVTTCARPSLPRLFCSPSLCPSSCPHTSSTGTIRTLQSLPSPLRRWPSAGRLRPIPSASLLTTFAGAHRSPSRPTPLRYL